MIITLLLILLFVLGALGMALFSYFHSKYSYVYKNSKLVSFFASDYLAITSIITLASGLVFSLFCLILILKVNIGRENDYKKMELRREVIIYRLEQDENNYILLSDEINEFNDIILTAKYYKDNLWFNWFINPLIAELDIITVGDY